MNTKKEIEEMIEEVRSNLDEVEKSLDRRMALVIAAYVLIVISLIAFDLFI